MKYLRYMYIIELKCTIENGNFPVIYPILLREMLFFAVKQSNTLYSCQENAILKYWHV